MDQCIYVSVNLKQSFGEMFVGRCFDITTFEQGWNSTVTLYSPKPGCCQTRINAEDDHMPEMAIYFFLGASNSISSTI